MFAAPSYVAQIEKKYPAPPACRMHFDENDIQRFEKELGLSLPSDFYDYLKIYGNGSFDDYFYIWCPFWESGTKGFLSYTTQAEENYHYLEKSNQDFIQARGFSPQLDCRFADDALVVVNGNPQNATFLRTEKIDRYTRSKILAFGDHYPYDFYPNKNGLLCFGRTDDDDFFVRIHGTRTSIVLFSEGYYEFDMGITEFIYGFLTQTIQLPMQNENNTDWNFVPYTNV